MRKTLLGVTLILGAFALGGAACDKGQITPAETVLLGCDAFASALNVVSGLNEEGKLSKGTVAIVDKSRDTVNPICEGKAPDVDATVRDVAVDAGTKTLLSIAASFGR